MKTLYESILDDEEDVIDRMGNEIISKKINDWLDNPKNCSLEEMYTSKGKLGKLTINSDGTIDYEGAVTVYTDLPDYIRFNKVKGEFGFYQRRQNSPITSIKGSPKEVEGWFRCDHLPGLKSLEGGPEKVTAMFDCCACPLVHTLKGCPKYVGGNFLCTGHFESEIRKYCKHIGGKIMGALKG